MDVVTFGQYMRPTKRHMKVERYVEPSEFDKWKRVAQDLGFLYVASGPLVRSSYKVSWCRLKPLCFSYRDFYQAGEFYIENILKGESSGKAQNILSQEFASPPSSILTVADP